MKKKKGSLLSTMFLMIFLICIASVGYLGWKEIRNELTVRDMEKEAQEYAGDDKGKKKKPKGYGFDWEGLMAENKDVIGWIRFKEPSRIDYPIVHRDSNQFYLKHNWKGQYQSAGAIFLHKRNSVNFTDPNSVIYGHRMISGSMFGSLKRYASQAYLDENKYFYIYTPDGKKRTYEIFAYSSVTDNSIAYETTFETKEERRAYYENIQKKAVTKRKIDIDEFDTTVTLSTCASRGYFNRIVVVGKLVEIEGET